MKETTIFIDENRFINNEIGGKVDATAPQRFIQGLLGTPHEGGVAQLVVGADPGFFAVVKEPVGNFQHPGRHFFQIESTAFQRMEQ